MRLVHVLPTFGLGGTELRVVSLINGLGPKFEHCIVPLNGVTTSFKRLDESANARLVGPPEARSWRTAFQLYRLLRLLKPDLLLTYNWGAIEALLAARVGRICPIIHNECGFGPDEVASLKRRRVLSRRLLLNSIPMTIVVSATLLGIAETTYRVRRERLRLIRTGVDCHRFAPRSDHNLRGCLGLNADTLLFGCVGGLRAEKNPAFLLTAFARANVPNSHLAVVGEGPLRRCLTELASDLAVAGRVSFIGPVDDPAPWYNAMDVFLMSSITEQTPNALLEAMASGLPAVCTAAGDTATILGSALPETVSPIGDMAVYVRVLQLLGRDESLRLNVGQCNRNRCVAEYSREQMIENYRAAYLSVILGRSSRLGEASLMERDIRNAK